MTDFDSKTFIKRLPSRPGVYRMFDEKEDILYVGKAKNLKNRVSSYFRSNALDSKTMALVSRIQNVETTVTGSETEALLLEQSLIKEYKPPYNIVFRDDKSYPYILLTTDDKYPRLAFHRGAQKKKGRYFGPFPSAYSVRDSLNILQKVFQVRQCEDTFFKNRARPCLQYQIKRCSGPCCGLVSPKDYEEDVQNAVMFLEGKSNAVMQDYANKMEDASEKLEFEKAAHYRDQVGHLRKIQEQQYVVGNQGDIDVHAVVINPGGVCVLVMFIRGGRMLGNKTFFPKTRLDEDESEVLAAFLPQFYLGGSGGRETPPEVVVNARIEDKFVLEEALTSQSGRKVMISDNVRSYRKRWIGLAVTNAEQSLGTHMASRNNLQQRFRSLQEALSLEEMPGRLECFDISHTSGEATVASCVVFDQNGPLKSDYRRFNIDGITPGDDYAAMSQALSRRYKRLQKGEGKRPDLLLIDGGKGQLTEAKAVMAELQLDIEILGIAKGPARKPGEETLFLVGRSGEVDLNADSPALHLLQQVRDEAHRFAITGHRQRRAKSRKISPLEGIDGMGPKRRQKLLQQFGGIQEVQRAGVEDIALVDGISEALAQKIYDVFHDEK